MVAGNSGESARITCIAWRHGACRQAPSQMLSLYMLRVLRTTLGEGSCVYATGTVEMSNVMYERMIIGKG